MLKKFIFLIVLLGFVAVQVRAATNYYVATNGLSISPYTTWANAATNIQDAVNLTLDGDTILVSNGTYYSCGQVTIGGYSAMIVVANGITLRSVNGPAVTIIDGNFPACTNRMFVLNNANAFVAGFTITNGNAGDAAVSGINHGSAVLLSGGGGTLSNCWITGNVCDRGAMDSYSCAGVFIQAGYLTMINCLLYGNTITNADCASAIRFYGPASGQILNCVISNNWATNGTTPAAIIGWGIISNCTIIGNHGGGVSIAAACTVDTCRIVGNTNTSSSGYIGGISAAGLVKNSWILNNYSAYRAGGVYLTGTLSNCVVSGNFAGDSNRGGGGVYTGGGAVLVNCIITSNSALGSAGGVCLFNTATLRNCLISSNNASQGGGVFFMPYYTTATGTIDNCTIVQNYASSKGGGVYCAGGQGSVCIGAINNTIIYSNNCASGPNWYKDGVTGLGFTNCCTTPTNDLPGSGNITNDPAFVGYAAGNYRLAISSPCINAGTNLSWMSGATDLDGHSRLDHYSRIVDMGCYEYLNSGSIYSFGF